MTWFDGLITRVAYATSRIGRKCRIRPVVADQEPPPAYRTRSEFTELREVGDGPASAGVFQVMPGPTWQSYGRGYGKSSGPADWWLDDGPGWRDHDLGVDALRAVVEHAQARAEAARVAAVEAERVEARRRRAAERWATLLDDAVWRQSVESARSVTVWAEDRARYSDEGWWWIWWDVLSRRWALNERRGAPPGFLPSREVARVEDDGPQLVVMGFGEPGLLTRALLAEAAAAGIATQFVDLDEGMRLEPWADS